MFELLRHGGRGRRGVGGQPPIQISRTVAVVALGIVTALPVAAEEAASPGASLSEEQVAALATRGWRASAGAAPGYLPDVACAQCHRKIARDYRTIGMGRSFDRPGANGWLEDFSGEPFLHEKSGRRYEMRRDPERGLLFRRTVLGEGGRELLPIEIEVDWVLGSGNNARTYLYRTPSGELFQLPLAWYSQEQRFAMAPGYDRVDHQGVQRLVRRGCVFCHTAYPEVETGSDLHHQPHLLPEELPRGIGCQRCHGPGARHAATVLLGGAAEDVEAAIVQPEKLSPELQRDVCYQCHLQPSVAIARPRRFDRTIFSYQPGEALSDYLVALDTLESRGDGGNQSHRDRFEINHHAYRLEQSDCFQKTPEGLVCTSCHDPHRKRPGSVALRARANAHCQSCHGALDAAHRVASLAAVGSAHDPGVGQVDDTSDHSLQTNATDCVACHMPQRRAEDVVHVVVTDHHIQRPLSGADWTRPLQEGEVVLHDLMPLRPEEDEPLIDLYRAAAIVRAGSNEAPRLLAELLAGLEEAPTEALFDVAMGALRSGVDPGATLTTLAEEMPDNAMVQEWRAIPLARSGEVAAARALLEPIVHPGQLRAESWYNRGMVELLAERPADAVPFLQRATELRPNLGLAWLWLAIAQLRVGDLAAADAAVEAVRLDPYEPRVLRLAVELLVAAERFEEARDLAFLAPADLRQQLERGLAEQQRSRR